LLKLTFPHMGNLWIMAQTLFESVNIDVVVPPENSKRTIMLGTKFSPESACLPLKLNLGNFIEAAEKGADTIAMTGGIGPCRFGYYGEVERQILKDAGYPYDVVILEPPDGSFHGLAQRIRYLVGKKVSWAKILQAMRFAYQKIIALDQIEDMIHAARPRLAQEAEKLYDEAKRRMAQTMSYTGVREVVRWLKESIRERQFSHQNTDRDESIGEPLRIGIVGEIYTVLDPFSSADVEQQLGQLGVHVDRSIYLSGWVGENVFRGLTDGYRSMNSYHKLAKPYLDHFVGGHGQESVGAAVKFAQEGFDGVIHLFPLTCMPEIVASEILPRVQNDYQIPIMKLIMDEHTGRTGVQTRLEAFVDLLERSRINKSRNLTSEEVLNLAGK
jgi:predicted nucleotide-binding protein (sugar kinase/HSP70/actin superfamily)